jgi:hypothetical protein
MKEGVGCRRESRSAMFRLDRGCMPFHPASHHLSNIVSTAKCRIGSGDDETPNRTVEDFMSGRFDGGIHLVGERISPFGSVQSQDADTSPVAIGVRRVPNITPGQFRRRFSHVAPKHMSMQRIDTPLAEYQRR